jgi:hypothetical protein
VRITDLLDVTLKKNEVKALAGQKKRHLLSNIRVVFFYSLLAMVIFQFG